MMGWRCDGFVISLLRSFFIFRDRITRVCTPGIVVPINLMCRLQVDKIFIKYLHVPLTWCDDVTMASLYRFSLFSRTMSPSGYCPIGPLYENLYWYNIKYNNLPA